MTQSPSSVTAPSEALSLAELTPNEIIRKRQLEAQIRMHLDSFWKCGEALFEMRESKLFRDEYHTFEQYCDDKWRFSDRHARRLIFAAQVIGKLGPVGPEIRESHIRELAPLQPDEYQPTWAQVVEAAKDNKITAALVRRVVKAATSVTIEVVQTQGHVSISENSIPLIEAGITKQVEEGMKRQAQNIADRTGRKPPIAVIETTYANSASDVATAIAAHCDELEKRYRIVVYEVTQ